MSSFQGYLQRDDGKNQGEYSAIFYDKNKLEVTKSGTFWLSETPEKPSKGWDAAYNRVCTYAFFKIKKTGKQFLAMNLHFDHVGDVARVNSAKLILEKIKKLNPKNVPLTLTGDFNLTDDSEPIKIISKSLDNVFYHSKKPHYGPKGTFTGFDINTIPQDRIDYIFVKGFEVLSNRTINDRRENLLYPSDHFPILAEINFKKQKYKNPLVERGFVFLLSKKIRSVLKIVILKFQKGKAAFANAKTAS